ncbi:MAG TPA: protein-S-isoprenylcysteine O-methyltransferase [Candidatus Polarisedimenticolaceae bacterium]|nr:protein-S-isoprenylcysteine O-methyltransferase [Candidatus Polarisedimenticolaceae bacterium]
MNVALAKGVVIAGMVVMIAIRAPHGQRSRTIKVAQSRQGPLETVLLALAWLGFLVPLVWLVTRWLAFAEYPLHPVAFVAGTSCLALALWLFHRAHADLGTNWSITLELRERHQLVTQGIYRRVRHPMYLALLLYSLGQLLVLPNWVAGPAYLAAFLPLFLFRVGPEERMMREAFGQEYEAYVARSKRLVPGVW